MPRVSLYENYSPATRGRIIGLLEGGYSAHEVSEIVGCNIKTVTLWKRKYEIGGDDFLKDHRKENKRPRLTAPDEDNNFIQSVLRQPFEAAEDHVARVGLRISKFTAHRRLKEAGIINRLAARKPNLTDLHRDARINYAFHCVGWHQNVWDRVIWSDEKLFSSSMCGKLKIWRPRSDRLNAAYVVPDNYSNRQNVMYWGCMTSYGLMALQEVSARMDSEEYIDILDEVMLPAAREIYPEEEYEEIFFMHDNSAVHTSRAVNRWFGLHPEILLLPHPAKSPDLNPIENIWSIMSSNWRSLQTPRTRQDVKNNVEEIWRILSHRVDITQNLASSMHRRLQAIIYNRGYWIKY